MNNNYGGKREGAGRKKKSVSEKFIPLSFTAAPDCVKFIKKSYELSSETSQSKFILNCLDLDNPTIIPGVVYSVYLYLDEDVYPQLIKDCRSLYEAMGLCITFNQSAMIMASIDDGHDALWDDFWYREDVMKNEYHPNWSFKQIDTKHPEYIESALKVYEEIKKLYTFPDEEIAVINNLKSLLQNK